MSSTLPWLRRAPGSQGRTRLSREGRDTLWLLTVLCLIVSPHLLRLPWWATVGAAASVIWRARLAWRDGALPPRWLLLVGLAMAMGATVLHFHTLFGREAGVTMVTLLASLKTLELRARRDAFVITSLGFFLILTQFLYSQTPWTALVMLAGFLGLLTSLVLAQRPLGRPTILSATAMACRSVLMGLPVMLALYLLFPRLGPLWTVPADAQRHTGLSDHIDLGKLAELAQDDSIAMRIHFDGPPPTRAQMYFRGPVLDLFDGRSWSSHPTPAALAPSLPDEPISAPPMTADVGNSGLPAPPPRLAYQVTIEPTHTDALPMLEGTITVNGQASGADLPLLRQSLSWRTSNPLNERVQMQGVALLRYVAGDPVLAPPSQISLQLPPAGNARTRAWAQAWRHEQGLDGADGLTLAQAILRYVRSQNFRYSLSAGTEDGTVQPDPIDQFWMDRRVGFCEHFATSFVFLMRTWGIPSRVVTGYQGAERNPFDGLYVVRNSDAHAWAEIWLPGHGWMRIDPTAAVAPDRIDKPRTQLSPQQGLAGPLAALNPEVWSTLRAYMEAGNHRWNTWVLQYSRNRQMDLLHDLGIDSPDWTDLLRISAGVLLSCGIAGLAWLWWTRPRLPSSPWRRPMMRVHRAMRSLGLPEPAMPAPASALAWIDVLQHTIDCIEPVTRAGLSQSLTELDALRYGPQHARPIALRHAVSPIIDRIETTVRTARKKSS